MKKAESQKTISASISRIDKKEDNIAILSQDSLSILLEDVDSPLMIIQNGKIVFVNQKGWDKFGYSVQKTIGKSVVDLIKKRIEKSSHELVINGYFKALLGELDSTLTLPIITENGECIPVEPKTAIIEYNGGPALLVLIRDLRTEPMTERSNERCKTDNARAFVSSDAQDLRNPLQSIKNVEYYLRQELLSNRGYLPNYNEIKHMIDILGDAVAQADKTITDLEATPPKRSSVQNWEYSE